MWGTFEIIKLTFLKNELDYYSSKISKTEWNTYSNWYFEASKHDQETKIASLQNVKINWGKQTIKER